MNARRSETLTGTIDVGFPEFLVPPADPVALAREWLRVAVELGVREPRALALATADTRGRPSTRMVAVNEIADEGLVFSTHASSQKGRELTENPWASGVWYWRETTQQIVVSGRVERLPDDRADELWFGRPWFTHAMSVASKQSEPLRDLNALRAEAQRLTDVGGPLPRPEGYSAFLIRFDSVEFWANGEDRLHERLRYDRTDAGWTARQLQP